MKTYNYKIQWITWSIKELETMITLWWVRWLDKINVRRSSDYKIIDSYTWYLSYHPWLAEEKTIDYLHSKELEYEKHWSYVYEVLRK